MASEVTVECCEALGAATGRRWAQILRFIMFTVKIGVNHPPVLRPPGGVERRRGSGRSGNDGVLEGTGREEPELAILLPMPTDDPLVDQDKPVTGKEQVRPGGWERPGVLFGPCVPYEGG